MTAADPPLEPPTPVDKNAIKAAVTIALGHINNQGYSKWRHVAIRRYDRYISVSERVEREQERRSKFNGKFIY